LDIIFSKKNILGINVNNLLQRKEIITIRNNNISVLSKQDEFLFYIRKKAFKKQDIQTHFKYLQNLLPNTTKKQIELEYKANIKFFNSYKFTLLFWVQKAKLFFVRVIENPSLIICFLGPDGSGKSTIIDRLKRNNPFINFKYFHLKPIVKKREIINLKKEENPHSQKEYSWFVSTLKIVFFVFQYNINWILNILSIKYTPTLIVFDRYFDDILADSKRYRYGGSLKFVSYVNRFIPKPDITFVLNAEPSIIHARKKEVTIIELTEQLNRYKLLTQINKSHVLIKVNKTIEEIVKEVNLNILKSKNDNK
jgi:thymidylate kinase